MGRPPRRTPTALGGFRVVPHAIELWQGRASRLHDRFRYERDAADPAVVAGAASRTLTANRSAERNVEGLMALVFASDFLAPESVVRPVAPPRPVVGPLTLELTAGGVTR